MSRLVWIWPAFLAACALEAAVFAFVDPLELHWAGHALGWSRQGAYTAAFFAFWAVSGAACGLTAWLQSSPAELKVDKARRTLG
ncbi:hypothetical protein FN976_03970 [Caenimonas sedimenti]|uniref:Uncharacterized protein n=1 Tax=Caenimonas sedimenti TaxID=2596921 RepID=A0A562ZWF9_9BURK|nr:hypothetical protein [Caenimonas sedimenti]TWO72697.1 hypothetical protein FN976_03970 [Caenimonas sedimenti]